MIRNIRNTFAKGPVMPSPSAEPAVPVRSPSRPTAVVAVGMSIAVWWPSFTLGAWGVLFFEQILSVWAAATAALLVVLIRRQDDRHRLAKAVALSVPTVWLVLAIAFRGDRGFLGPVVDTLGGTVAILGIPATIWVLARIIWPEFGEDLPLMWRIIVVAAVLAIAATCFLLGRNHAAFLTCEDFTISGNSEPPGCTPAP
ncbi:hypothetical protein [Arthrobacter agilis]|uniref:hypothetical protein n=1 Tax=Arthrobacter agilis TaxID=37921 RepID=UPI0027D7F326|nr:hypothetical protein [Arthrobacter agilis]